VITDGEQQVIELFVRHQTRIKGFIAALMGDFAAVPDVLQETFLVVQPTRWRRTASKPSRSVSSARARSFGPCVVCKGGTGLNHRWKRWRTDLVPADRYRQRHAVPARLGHS
jgi:hypothetical protein